MINKGYSAFFFPSLSLILEQDYQNLEISILVGLTIQSGSAGKNDRKTLRRHLEDILLIWLVEELTFSVND